MHSEKYRYMQTDFENMEINIKNHSSIPQTYRRIVTWNLVETVAPSPKGSTTFKA